MTETKPGSDLTTKVEQGLQKSPATLQREKVSSLLTQYKQQIQMALPKHITADRLIRVALTAINKTPALLECTTTSLMGCIINSAQLGLMPDGILGEGYLIPFRNNKSNPPRMECQFMIGYRGIIKLAYQSGQVKSLQARAVYANDDFKYEFGLNEILEHKPTEKEKRGDLTHVYCVILLNGGGHVFDVMNKTEVEKIRSMSKAPNSPAWKEHYSEMAIKTVIRKVAKRCPLSPEFVNAALMDEQVELGQSQNASRLVLDLPTGELTNEASKEFEDAVVQEKEEIKKGEKTKSSDKGKGATASVETSLENL